MNETYRDLEIKIKALPELSSSVLQLHFIEERELEDIGQMLGISLQKTKRHLARGIFLLQKKLGSTLNGEKYQKEQQRLPNQISF